MKESLTVFIIISGTLVFLIFLTLERIRQKRARKKLKHVIYVNGTRGKSTVTRMIDAGLRAGGFRVLSKTTGTLPMILHADGRVEEIHRRAPANIREQLRTLHLAVKEGADILVVECMALSPENQFVSQHRMLEADIGVLTNVRLDHQDVMGKTREDILNTLLNTLPVGGTFLTAEADLIRRIEERAARLGSRAVLARPEPEDEGIDFPENAALARLVCETLGMEPAAARAGISRYIRDPFAKELLHIGKTVFVNALSANDTESTLRIAEEGIRAAEQDARRVLLINNRGDRPARAQSMGELAAAWKPEEIWLTGEDLSALKRLLKRRLPDVPVRCFRKVGEVPLDPDVPTLLLASGNIRGAGISLTERARKLAKGEGA